VQTIEDKLKSYPELPPRVALLWGMLEATREKTHKFVNGLSEKELSTRAAPGAHTIGTLLTHIAETEFSWVKEVILGKPLSQEEKKTFRSDLYGKPDDPQAPPVPLEFFLENLQLVRQLTKETVFKLKDAELESVRIEEGKEKRYEDSIGWILYHLVEHEAGHQGQIAMLKRLIREKNGSKT
jgi:uncharacterized damage-inducible protein DinB